MVKNKQVLKNFYGKVIGTIETDEKGVQTLKDFYFKVLGKYYPDADITKDFYGKVVGKGNLLGTLIREK